MTITCYVINDNQELNLFKKDCSRNNMSPLYLTISPESYFSLQGTDNNYKSPHEFVTKKQLNKISENNFKLAKLIVNKMEVWLHENHPEIPDAFKPFYSIEHGIKNFIDSIAFTLKELTNLCSSENIEEIIYCTNNPGSKYIHYINENNKDRYFSIRPIGVNISSLVLDQSEWWNALGIKTIPIYNQNLKINPKKVTIKNKITQLFNPNRIDLFKQLINKAPKLLLSLKSQRVLVIGQADNIKPFLSYSINTKKIKIDWWVRDTSDPVNFPTLQNINLQYIGSKTNFKDKEIPKNLFDDLRSDNIKIPILNVIYKSLNNFYKYRIPYLLSLYVKAQSYFKNYQPICILSGTTDPDRIQIVHQAAKSFRIPLIAFQHGGAYGYTETKWIQLSDLRADIYAAYGQKSSEYIKEFAQSIGMPTKSVNIGWKNRKHVQKKSIHNKLNEIKNLPINIIYVPTGMMGDNRYGPDHDQMHDVKYCLEQIEIINALTSISNTNITVKLHYKDKIPNPIENFIKNSKLPNLKVLKNCNFTDLIDEADVIIIDCPTTVIIESLACEKKVIYIDLDIVKFTKDGEEIIKESVLWIKKDHQLKENLQKNITKISHINGNFVHDEFMKQYANTEFKPQNIWNIINK
ncbi:MAG: hypothetical protein CL758_00980 [Chloroflexi bacterium]|nr:hypothetical protein [Chloroflexota bacterium]